MEFRFLTGRAKESSSGGLPYYITEKEAVSSGPTGVGKTISTLFPSVKAIGEEAGERFLPDGKTITRTVAEQAFRILGEQGLQMKVITLTAKEKICINVRRQNAILFHVHMQRSF